jgi:hypothetical protein
VDISVDTEVHTSFQHCVYPSGSLEKIASSSFIFADSEVLAVVWITRMYEEQEVVAEWEQEEVEMQGAEGLVLLLGVPQSIPL